MPTRTGGRRSTPDRLMSAAIDIVRDEGVAAASARTIATRAGVNQALIFYHFETVSGLIEAASNRAVDRSIESYRGRFDAARTLGELLEVGRTVHEAERRNGNVAVMAQLLAGAQHNPVLARAAGYAMTAWTDHLTPAVERALAKTPLAGAVAAAGLAQTISTGFVGLELYAGIRPDGAQEVLATLQRLGELLDQMASLGPLAAAATRVRTRSSSRGPGRSQK